MTEASRQKHVFDVGALQVAAIYAKAFAGAAESAGQTDGLADELDALVDEVLDRHPEFDRILESEFIDPEKKEAILDRVLGGRVTPTLLAFLKVLAGHGRLGYLAAIQRRVRQMLNERSGRVAVTVTTATPLGDASRSELLPSLRQLLGAEPELTEVTDSSVLGGVVLRVGDTVFDGSLAAQLQRTRALMLAQSIEQIQIRRERFL